ncbi:MAG: DUF565 domain-containing protein [Cyanobacteriota bacterium]|nr:DUF565 domain-containing protein [Cyanobacteriota bacterium]
MSRLPLQQTRYNRLQAALGRSLAAALGGSWRTFSLQLLALLLGFYLGSNLTSFVLLRIPGGRPSAVLLMVLGVELLIRVRTRAVRDRPSLGWVICDNLRIGAVYAVVLEAFKVGT